MKNTRFALLLTITLIANLGWAAEPAQEFAVPFKVEENATMDIFSKESRKEIQKTVLDGLLLVAQAAPEEDCFFTWQGDKTPLKGKSLVLEMTTSIASWATRASPARPRRCWAPCKCRS